MLHPGVHTSLLWKLSIAASVVGMVLLYIGVFVVATEAPEILCLRINGAF